MRPPLAWAVALAALSALPSAAQEATSAAPPRILALEREEIRPGHLAAFERLSASQIALLGRAGASSRWIALTPISGDGNLVLCVRAFGSFAEVEADRQRTDEAMAAPASRAELEQLERQGAEVRGAQQLWLALHRPDLSYRPVAVDFGQSRFLNLVTVRIRPGRVPDYVDYVKTLNAAREKAGSDAHSLIYQLVSGGSAGTFLIVTANRSLKELDESVVQAEERDQAVASLLGGETALQKRRQLLFEVVADSTSALFAVNPRLSRPPAAVAAADPAFWNPRPPADGKATAVKKDTERTRQKP